MTLARTLSLACILVVISFSAEARTRHHDDTTIPFYDRHAITEIGARMFIRDVGVQKVKRAARGKSASRKTNSGARTVHSRERSSSAVVRHGEAQLLPHPAGCPSRAFCGCGASIEVFGRSIRELWLAAAWFKFPRAAPAPGMVAVRRHHVFVIREVRAPGLVLAYDANSGGRRTRIHLRSLAGYTVVNPRGSSRYATAL